jgi:threonine dehydrogenase-like Zn-dependent dehydrogenase
VHGDQHIYRLPEGVTDAAAAGANCALSQVLFGLDQVGVAIGETVLVQGAGGLGLYAAAVAGENGERVIVIDPVGARLDLAGQFGADDHVQLTDGMSTDDVRAAIRAVSGGHDPDLAVELTGRPEAFSQGLDLIRRGGRYLVMGNISPGQSVPYDPGLVTRRALTLRHIDRYDGRNLALALDFLSRHGERYPFDRLVDATFPLSATEDALMASVKHTVTRAAIIPGA